MRTLLLFLFLSTLTLPAQNLDSLRRVAEDPSQPDTARLRAMYDLADAYLYTNPDSLAYFARQQYQLARAIDDLAAQGRALQMLGIWHGTRGAYEAAEDTLRLGLALSEQSGDRAAVARTLNGIGIIHQYQADYAQALAYFQRSLKVAEEIGDSLRISMLLGSLGTLNRLQDNFAQALDDYQRALKIATEIGSLTEMYYSSGGIGDMYALQGNYAQALDNYQRRLRIAEEMGEPSRISTSLLKIGDIYNTQGNYAQALAYFQRSLKLAEDSREKVPISWARLYLAKAHQKLNQDSLALSNAQKAIVLAKAVANPRTEALGRNVLGKVYQRKGQAQLAQQAYQSSLTLGNEIGDTDVQTYALTGLAQLAQQQQNWLQARNYAQQALTIAQPIGLAAETRDAAEVLWQSQAALGDSSAALRSLLTFVEVNDSLNSLQNQQALTGYQYELEAEQDSLAAAAQQAETELAYQQQLTQRNYWLFGGLIAGLLLFAGLYIWRQRKAKQQELARLQQIDRLKDQFLANTSHELRTPLNGIIGLAEDLYEREDNPQDRQNLGMVVASGKRLASLVNDLLDFSRLRNADLQLRPKPVDLRTLTEVVLQVSQPLLQGKEVQLVNDIPTELPAAFADEDRLMQILHNLVGNAVKFTETGEVRVLGGIGEIGGIGAGASGDQLTVAVQDTGIGIPPEKHEAIFAAFEQADGSISRQYSGTGLGLSITKQLVEAQGGQIGVESTPGEGSTFWFTLPVSEEKAQGNSQAARLTPLMAAEPTDLVGFENLRGLPSTRLLIVDDEPINHQVLKNHLRGDRFEVASAMNGPEALQKLKEDDFDLVLLDLMMPGMSGYEVAAEIRQDFLPSELPIIMITAKNQVADLVQGLNQGANDYLAKPFSKDEFLARLNTHLNLG